MSKIEINQLPVPTWTWLKVNEKSIEVPERIVPVEISTETMPAEVTEGTVADITVTGFDGMELGAGQDFKNYVVNADFPAVSYSVEAGVKVAEPIRINVSAAGNADECALNSMTFSLGEGAELTAVLIFKGEGTIANDIRIEAEKDAKLTLVEVFQLGDKAVFIDSIGGTYDEKGGLKLIQLSDNNEADASSSQNISLSCAAELVGDKSTLDIDTAYLAKGDDKLDINYVARHKGCLTDSKINVSGVLRDKADKTFRGTIDFIKGCKDATGDEREDVLLMDEGVHNRTVPLILCAEEDVEGAHGASIGKISDEILLYFQTRGISEDDINELMAKSRIDAVAGRIPDEKTRELLLSE